jgi:hypothetical protein
LIKIDAAAHRAVEDDAYFVVWAGLDPVAHLLLKQEQCPGQVAARGALQQQQQELCGPPGAPDTVG